MGLDPVTWAFGFVLTKSANWFLGKIVSEDLPAKLRREVKEWTEELPAEVWVHPEALFPRIEDQEQDIGPALRQLRETLRVEQIPTEQQWNDAILEHRNVIVAAERQDDLQPFFRAEVDDIRDQVHSLAQRIHRICQQNEALFRTGVIAPFPTQR
jgi:hypothetical protein